MPKTNKKQITPKEARPISTTDKVRLSLWVRAGGRCEFHGCNKYLLDDDFTGFREVNLADVAHIVGRKTKAARGDDVLPVEERNKVENLLLLCSEHHNKIIDKAKLLADFPKEKLLKYKHDHEELIKYLTELALPGFATVTLRMLGHIRGNAVSVPDEQVRSTVLNANKYPRYLLSKQNSIEIDLTGFDENDSTYWEQGFKAIDRVVDRQIFPAITEKIIDHLSVFPFARIPFIIYLGYKLADKVTTDIYQKQRDEGEMWTWQEVEPVNFEYRKLRDGKDPTKVAVLLSLSGFVSQDSTPLDDQFTLYEILPTGVQPNRSIFEAKQTLNAFRKTYQQWLRFTEANHQNVDTIHLFPAIPISAAFHCGRELLKGTTPKIVIYDRDNNFKFIKINELI